MGTRADTDTASVQGGAKQLVWAVTLLLRLVRLSVQSRPTLCDPMNRSTPGLPVHHQLPEFTLEVLKKEKAWRW